MLSKKNILTTKILRFTVLVKCKETPQPIVIIDFDWGGKNGVARYPLFMNRIDVTWPEGASDVELLQPDHDKYWMEKTFS